MRVQTDATLQDYAQVNKIFVKCEAHSTSPVRRAYDRLRPSVYLRGELRAGSLSYPGLPYIAPPCLHWITIRPSHIW